VTVALGLVSRVGIRRRPGVAPGLGLWIGLRLRLRLRFGLGARGARAAAALCRDALGALRAGVGAAALLGARRPPTIGEAQPRLTVRAALAGGTEGAVAASVCVGQADVGDLAALELHALTRPPLGAVTAALAGAKRIPPLPADAEVPRGAGPARAAGVADGPLSVGAGLGAAPEAADSARRAVAVVAALGGDV